MARQNAISKEAREYITQTVKERGIVTVEGVSEIVSKHYQFDPERSKKREIMNCARHILASIKNRSGERTLLSVKGEHGKFVDLDHCKDLHSAQKVREQLADKRDGLNRNIAKADRKIQELEGQISISDMMRKASGAAVHRF